MGDLFEVSVAANRTYKDSVFTLLFGTKDEAARICNTFFGTNYSPDDIELVTLMNVLYRDRINDLAFVVDGKLIVLIEHQSTINNNMAIRLLQYYAKTIDRLIKEKDVYGKKKIPLPQPVFIVLYNGIEDMPDYMEIKLSDHFIKNDRLDGQPPMLELTAKIYNINKGRNPQFAERNPTLLGYEVFVAMVRENQKTMSLEEAIKKAVQDCIEQNILKDFLVKHKPEVVNMLLTEWKFEDELAVREMEAEEKRAKNTAKNLLRRGRLTVDEIAEDTGLDVTDIVMLQSEITNAS